MGLKLTVSRKDKIIMSNGVVITVNTHTDKQTQLEFSAPREIEIHTIFDDPAKQFKKLRRHEAKLAGLSGNS